MLSSSKMEINMSYFLVILMSLCYCEGYKILVIVPTPATSHSILGNGLVRNLLNADHEVTYITPFPTGSNDKKLKELNVPEIIELYRLDEHTNLQKLIDNKGMDVDRVYHQQFLLKIYTYILNNENVKNLFSDTNKQFDVVISEWFYSEFNSGIMIPTERKLYETEFRPWASLRGHTLPAYDEIRLNASLILGNSHATLGQALRLPQNYKPIAGFHIDPEVKPLPENLQKIMDQAKNGVIYFSMGSILNSKHFPDELKIEFIKMFGELDYTVLWKFEEILPNLPKNLHILKWAPQPSILSHLNCKLFITHGGLLSTTESIHYGVPIIGIPGFGDQFINVERAVRKGFAKRVDLSYTMVRELKMAIHDILSTDSYTQNVKKLSFSYHHRPVPPGKEVVHWVEHVIQTQGAPYLRSPALMIPWYQKAYIDLLLIIIIIIVIVKLIIRRLFLSKRLDTIKKNK